MAPLAVRLLLLAVAVLVCLVNGAPELDLTEKTKFDEAITVEDRALVVKFYSAMCGSCKEFNPTWERLQTQMENFVVFGSVNIDTKSGLAIARDLGVLDEGLPSVRVFATKDAEDKGVSCIKNPEQSTHKHVMSNIRKVVMALQKNEAGFYLKGAKVSVPMKRHEGGVNRRSPLGQGL